jgi:hypothetical protein
MVCTGYMNLTLNRTRSALEKSFWGFGGICRKGKYRKKKQENVEKKNAERVNSEIKNLELGKRRK